MVLSIYLVSLISEHLANSQLNSTIQFQIQMSMTPYLVTLSGPRLFPRIARTTMTPRSQQVLPTLPRLLLPHRPVLFPIHPPPTTVVTRWTPSSPCRHHLHLVRVPPSPRTVTGSTLPSSNPPCCRGSSRSPPSPTGRPPSDGIPCMTVPSATTSLTWPS